MSLPASLTIEALARLAIEAGLVIERLYADGCTVTAKADASPVTEADRAAEAVILAGLKRIAPDLPVIAEEEAAAGRVPAPDSVFALVDPLDGTREFVSKNGEFTVNIAIVRDGAPVMGVIYAPVLHRLWAGTVGAGAWRAEIVDGTWAATHPIGVRPAPATGLTVLASRSHRSPETEEWIARYPVAAIESAGSSLKFCLVAEGRADLYPRLGRTMEWDTAAGHAILAAAGGQVLTLDGLPLTYGKRDRGFDNPHFVALGDQSIWNG